MKSARVKHRQEGMSEKTYFVYILRCADDTLYTGITNDLIKRLRAHNNGTAAKYTRSRRPVQMIYSEAAADKSAALKRESQIKSFTREEKLQLISRNNSNTDL